MAMSSQHAGPRRLQVQEVLLGCALLTAGLLSTSEQWHDLDLVLTLGALAVATHLLPFTARGVHISGSFMGLVLLMALAGPTPAAAVGVIAVGLDAVRTRPARWHLVTDLVTYVTFPLVGGVAFQVVRSAGLEPDSDGYALAVACLFMAVNILNFVLVVEQTRLHKPDLPPLSRMLQGNVVPVLPWQLAAAFVTATAAYGEAQFGLAAVGLLACVLFTFQLLLRAVLEAEHQRDELARSFADLGEMHRGLLAAMLNTLSLRDPMTARHSAAVARYALAVAEAAGLSAIDQELAHTAGLVHDIGKASFDDGLLHSRGPLSDQQRRMIRRHPSDGARVLRGVQGYELVADIVESHHERWDGGGYPRGLAGDQIPELARILAVADTYDVMTGRDTYREPVTHADAVAELRRVAGTQLDPRHVELFVATVEEQHIGFAHADDRDLEVELRRPRTVLA
jgi:putative nucleotidyltransferase with HDIG domain